ncbi:MAG: hypothetical protein Q9164_005777 [Protoblastenia rupestris]
MSHYISSFLIDPVVRQARRFSRPSFGGIEEADHHDGLATAATAAHEELPNLRHDIVTERYDGTVLGDSEVVLPRSLDALHGEGPQDWHAENETTENLHLIEMENLEPAVPARQYTIQTTSETSYNTQQRLSNSLRSDTSSLSGSNRSMISLTDGQSQSSSARNADPRDGSRNQRASTGDRTLPEDDDETTHPRNTADEQLE